MSNKTIKEILELYGTFEIIDGAYNNEHYKIHVFCGVRVCGIQFYSYQKSTEDVQTELRDLMLKTVEEIENEN